jgi:prepilin-type N-terminal cleavage/methylation domain-containing protein
VKCHQPKSRAFTLTELLVVISLVVLLLAVAVPAFSSMLYSNDRSLADNQLRIAMQNARDAAVRSDGGDTAAVFILPPNGKLRIVTCVRVGELNDTDNQGRPVVRDVFVPVPLLQPIDLPKGWTVRGFAAPGSIVQNPAVPGWYEGAHLVAGEGNWILPETGFFNSTVSNDGRNRQSFMIRFSAGTGAAAPRSSREALVLDIIGTQAFRNAGVFANYRLDQATDVAAMTRRILDVGSGLSLAQQRELLGDTASDTILCREVAQVSLQDERRVASGLGGRGVNSATGSIYGTPGSPQVVPNTPTIDTSLFNLGDGREVSRAINELVVGQYRGRDGKKVQTEVKLFGLDRYSGRVREVTP